MKVTNDFLDAIIKGAIVDVRKNLTPREIIEEYMGADNDLEQYVTAEALPDGYPHYTRSGE